MIFDVRLLVSPQDHENCKGWMNEIFLCLRGNIRECLMNFEVMNGGERGLGCE